MNKFGWLALGVIGTLAAKSEFVQKYAKKAKDWAEDKLDNVLQSSDNDEDSDDEN